MASPPMPSMCCSTTICRPQRAAPAQCSAKQWSGSLTRLSYWAVASWGSATGMLQLQVWPFGQMLIPFWEWRWRWSGHALAKFQKNLKNQSQGLCLANWGQERDQLGKTRKRLKKLKKKQLLNLVWDEISCSWIHCRIHCDLLPLLHAAGSLSVFCTAFFTAKFRQLCFIVTWQQELGKG